MEILDTIVKLSIMHNPNFYTIDKFGHKILRNLEQENSDKRFSIDRYHNREDGLDSMNYMYFENFQLHDLFDSFGSDYERYGCVIEEGDVVVDIGGNIGMFTRRAIERGASKVIAFEPMSHTFSCLVDNVGEIAECHKLAIGNEMSTLTFATPDDRSNLGGGSREDFLSGRNKVKEERCISFGLEDLWRIGVLPEKIDFMKIDCEGGEKEIIENLSDERLHNIRKLSMEYHQSILGPELRENFTRKAESLGFRHFTLFHGDGGLVQLHLWK